VLQQLHYYPFVLIVLLFTVVFSISVIRQKRHSFTENVTPDIHSLNYLFRASGI